MKRKPEEKKDIDECRDKIKALLEEYNCSICSADEWHAVLITDNDTDETRGFS